MTKEDFDQTLRTLNRAEPFRPFAVELSNGERLEIPRAGLMAFRAGTAVYVDRKKIPHIFYYNTITRFDPAPPSVARGNGAENGAVGHVEQRRVPMTKENFDHLITTLWRLRPFRIFTVELMTGQRFEVDHHEALIYRDGTAVFVGPGAIPYWFDHESVNQVIGAPVSQAAT